MFHNIWSISKKEMKLFFVSFVAYIVLFFLLLAGGYYFYVYIFELRDASMVIPYFLNVLGFLSFIFTPFITMRVFSEEKRSGTIELLITAPLKEIEIVLGKFLGTFLFYLVYVGFTLYYLIILIAFGSPDFGPIITGYLGFILLEAAFISIGILISVTTRNQIVSGLVTLIALLILWIIGWISSYFSGTLRSVLEYLSFMKHFEDFTKGIVDTRHIIFYLSVIGLNLFWTIKLLENRKAVV